MSPSQSLWSAADPHPRNHAPTATAERPVPRTPRTPPPPPPPPPGPPRRKRPPEQSRRARATALALIAGLAVGGAGTYAVFGSDDSAAPPAATASAEPAPAGTGGGTGTPVGDIYAAASPAVVSVKTDSGEGTGFVVDREGTIVTNAHVVGSSDQVQVRFGEKGRTFDAGVQGRDVSTDLAVLHVDPAAVSNVKPLALANSDDVRVGDRVVAIGNPFGLDRTATTGIVSAVGREISAPNGFSIDKVIQTDAPINPGNSGGPLIDSRGRVVGVNSQIAAAGGGGNVGIGFAVPSNTLREMLPRLVEGQTIERPYLGVSTAAGNGGAAVQEVTPNSPAQRAGLQGGDVIAAVDGKPIGEPADIASAIADKRPGDAIEVDVIRDGSREQVQVDLGTRPAQTP